jgi:hypothetical protein
MTGVFFAGVVTGVISVFIVSLSVAGLAVRYMHRIDRNTEKGIGSEDGITRNPMEGISYHGPVNPQEPSED